MFLAEKDKEVFTYKDYKSWPSDERWELIYGEAFNMSPTPSITHQKIAGLIFNQLSEKISNCQVFIAPVDVLLKNKEKNKDLSDDDINTIVQPDILVVCDQSKIGKQNINGAPDLIVEVLSPATAKKDEGLKRDLYQHNGVKEYWLIHPTDKTVNQYILSNNIYEKPSIYGETDSIEASILADLSIDLSQIFTKD